MLIVLHLVTPAWMLPVRLGALRVQGDRQDQAAPSPRDRWAPHAHPRSYSSDLPASGAWKPGDRCFHDKFGYGTIKRADGAKLTVAFDKAGQAATEPVPRAFGIDPTGQFLYSAGLESGRLKIKRTFLDGGFVRNDGICRHQQGQQRQFGHKK